MKYIDRIETIITTLGKNDLVPYFIGHAGMGKTSMVAQIAKKLEYDYISIVIGQYEDNGDLLGLSEIRDGKTYFAKPSFFPDGSRPTILHLDEINRVKPHMKSILFDLLLFKKIGPHQLPKNTIIVASANPSTEDYEVLDFNDSALQDRLAYFLFEPPYGEWLNYLNEAHDLSWETEFLRENSNYLDSKDISSQINIVKPTRRSVQAAMKISKEKIESNLKKEIYIGLLGLEMGIHLHKAEFESVDRVEFSLLVQDYGKIKPKIHNLVTTNKHDVINKCIDYIMDHLEKVQNEVSEEAVTAISDLMVDNKVPSEYRTKLSRFLLDEKFGYDRKNGFNFRIMDEVLRKYN